MPIFHPRHGKVDFLGDRSLGFLLEYIKFLQVVESQIGEDMRMQLEAVSYEQFLKKYTNMANAQSGLFRDDEIAF